VSVEALLSYALSVPDLESGRRFYSTFGLNPAERGGTLAFRCDGREQDQVLLVEGPRKRLHHLRFGTDEAGLGTIRTRMHQRRMAEEDAPLDDFACGIWLRDPDGNPINIRNESAQPWRSGKPVQINQPGHYSRFERGSPSPHPVRPTRLGHVLLFTPRLEEMVSFYRELLGMRLSDQVPGIISFLHLPCGGDHHVLALAKDAKPGFHHASFEVESPDEIGLGAQAVLAAGYRNGWGFGRHVIGSNYFHYLRDPWMSLAEYFCDIDQIPGDGSWQPQDLEPADALYRWGPEPPPDFIRNFEAV
jgi:catechol 2,3-dioxygenase-like lactoylglutathione lyase family enzyme